METMWPVPRQCTDMWSKSRRLIVLPVPVPVPVPGGSGRSQCSVRIFLGHGGDTSFPVAGLRGPKWDTMTS
jgi:hypothetical protein